MNSTIKLATAGLMAAVFIAVSAGNLYSQRERPAPRGERVERGEHHRGGQGMQQPHGQHRMNHMQERLDLSDAQVQKIHDINTKYRDQIFENRKDSEKVNELRQNKHNEIKEVLTDEQKEKLNTGVRGRYGRPCVIGN